MKTIACAITLALATLITLDGGAQYACAFTGKKGKGKKRSRKNSNVKAASAVVSWGVAEFEGLRGLAVEKEQTVRAFVKFFTPSCHHCRQLAPQYEKVAELVAQADTEVVIAEFDCSKSTAAEQICHDEGASALPHIKYLEYRPGSKRRFTQSYVGTRGVRDISVFVEWCAGITVPSLSDAQRLIGNIGRTFFTMLGWSLEVHGTHVPTYRSTFTFIILIGFPALVALGCCCICCNACCEDTEEFPANPTPRTNSATSAERAAGDTISTGGPVRSKMD